MKIIQVDNFDREIVSDILIAENVPEHFAELIVTYLNNTLSGPCSLDYYKRVPDDYKLYKFEP
jgi:hypothetical protein